MGRILLGVLVMGERILVCGGRDFSDVKLLWAYLDGLPFVVDLVITGGAKGADALADKWAAARGKARAIFPANWDGEGKSAGHRRNERMLEIGRPNRVIAFPGGRGTSNMIRRARDHGVPVEIVDPEAERMLS